MIYTFLLYIIVFIVLKTGKNTQRSLVIVFSIVGIYLGIRYNYMPDYVQYHKVFDMFNAYSDYVYDGEVDHAEYGWFLINRLFKPLGFFFFVFVCSVLFAISNYELFRLYNIDKNLLLVAIFGMITSANFAILSSAQRQFLATAVFLFAFRYCIYGRIHKYKDLFSKHAILYFFFIWVASTFHSSALVLMIVPFLYFVPYKSKVIVIGLGTLFLAVLFAGASFLPSIMGAIIEKSGSYEYLAEAIATNEQTLLGTSMMILRVAMILFVLAKCNLPREEAVVLLIAYISAIFTASTYSVVQVDRLSFYIIAFDYLSYAVILKHLPKQYSTPYCLIIWVWYLWGVAKLLQPVQYDWQVYKTIFSVL